jgi:hypothetical protein
MSGVAVPMIDPRRGAVRGARAAVLSVTAVAVAGAAHTLVDGCLDLDGLLLALGLCWPAAVAVLGARRRLPALVAWAVAAQVLTHVVVELTCGGSPAVPARALLLHAAAVVVTTALLHRADAGLWTAHALLRALARFLPRALVVVPLPPTPLAPLPDAVLLPFVPWRALPRARRGPPVGRLLTT